MSRIVACHKMQRVELAQPYLNFGYILVSIIEVEILWSIPKNVLKYNRESI